MIVLTLKPSPVVSLDAEMLSPDVMLTLTTDAIRALPIYAGKRAGRVDEWFTVEGAASDQLAIRGDVSNVHWIGRGMTRGTIAIDGSAGRHLGASMTGGAIEVSGDVSDWLGAEMAGGLIRVHGRAGSQVGAAYRGSLSGMTDGTILIDGAAGREVGRRMKRGTIAIGGAAEDLAGAQMKGGTIVMRGGAARDTGAWMVRGTIISLVPLPLASTFPYASTYNPTFVRLYAKHFAALGLTLPHEEQEGAYERYTGDASVPGRGEILVWKPRT